MPLSGGRRRPCAKEAAVELLPVEKDSVNGIVMIKYLAMIAAWVGEKDLACEQLATAVHCPTSGMDLSYGELKLMPFWGLAARRAVLRKNRRLPRAKVMQL
jgi:hypothetical protein